MNNSYINNVDDNTNNKKKKIIISSIVGVIIIIVILLIVILNNGNGNHKWSIDKGTNDMCAQMIETIYEDNDYIYSVSNSCVAGYKVVYSNGESYSIKEALQKGKVTVDDLINNGVNIFKDKK